MLDCESIFDDHTTDVDATSHQSSTRTVIFPAEFDPHYTFLSYGGERVSVGLAEFSQVRRYRDFCRIEAVVYVTFQRHPSLPYETASILTSVPMLKSATPGVLRGNLIRSAVNLALLMPNFSQGGLLKTA